MIQIFEIIVLIFSAIIHEYSHGFLADQLGDSTAKDAGRLTLNPIPHLDLFGSIILPLLMVISGSGMVFAWAKPVPFNPYNLRDQKFGPAKIAIAGPLSNLFLAIVFGLILRFVPLGNEAFQTFLAIIVYINLILAIFNLVPIPPLDGSKILAAFLPIAWQEKLFALERYGLILVILFLYFGYSLITPIIGGLFYLIVGTPIF